MGYETGLAMGTFKHGMFYINLGMNILTLQVLQAQLIRAERERILQQVKSGELPADTVLPKRFSDDDFDEDDYRIRRVKGQSHPTKFNPLHFKAFQISA